MVVTSLMRSRITAVERGGNEDGTSGLGLEYQHVSPDLNLVPVPQQGRSPDLLPVDPRPGERVQILDIELVIHAENPGVSPADARVRKHEVACRRSAKD